MNIGISSDEHFDLFKNLSQGVVRPDGLSKRLGELVDDAKAQKDRLILHGVRVLVRCGDLFNSRTSINGMTLSAVKEVLDYRSDILEEVIIAGNHDEYLFDSRRVAPEAFAGAGNVHYLSAESAPFSYETVVICGIAYQNEEKKFMSDLEIVKNSLTTVNCIAKRKVLLLHQSTSDIPLVSGITENTWLSADWLNKNTNEFDWVLLGHNHNSKRVGKVFSPGSAAQLNFGDANADRGVWVLDLNIGKFSLQSYTGRPFIEMSLDDLHEESNFYDVLEEAQPYLKIRADRSKLTAQDDAFFSKLDSFTIVNEQAKRVNNDDGASIENVMFNPYEAVEEILKGSPEELDTDFLLTEFNDIKNSITVK